MCDNGMEYIDQNFRGDNHPPLGEHLNYEVKLDLKGAKEGRQANMSNTHISLDDK